MTPEPKDREALDLEAIKARVAAASPGIWAAGFWSGQCREKHVHGKGCKYKYSLDVSSEYWRSHVAGPEPVMIISGGESGPIISEANAQFIAHARQDIPALIAEVESLREANFSLRSDLLLAGSAIGNIVAAAKDYVLARRRTDSAERDPALSAWTNLCMAVDAAPTEPNNRSEA